MWETRPVTPTYDDQDPASRDDLPDAPAGAESRPTTGTDPTRTFPAAAPATGAYGATAASARLDPAPTPPIPATPSVPAQRPRPRAGTIAGWGVLAITLITSSVVAIITSTSGFTLDNDIRRWMVDNSVPYYWFVLGAVWIAFLGLLFAALASCRTGGRALGVVVLWLLTGVSIVLMPIVAQIGALRTPETMANLYRVTPGLVVMFAAGTWLVAGRRSVLAPFTAILGLPLGIALQVVPGGQWPGSGPPGPDETIEPYFLDPELVLWPLRGGGYWILLPAIVAIVWLGVGVDALASPRSRTAGGAAPSPVGYGYGRPVPSAPGQAYSQVPHSYPPQYPAAPGPPYGGPYGPAPGSPVGPPPAPMPAPPVGQRPAPHGRPTPPPEPAPAQPAPQAYSAWLPAPPTRPGPTGPQWPAPPQAGPASGVDEHTVARGIPLPGPDTSPVDEHTVARGIPLTAPEDGPATTAQD